MGSRRGPEPPQRLACDLTVVEGDRAIAEDLDVLVALARDHDRIARSRERDGGRDGFAPVRDACA